MSFLKCIFSASVVLAIASSVGALPAAGADVQARFHLKDISVGPFPSDHFTILDNTQITGQRVDLPKPDCARQPSDCDDISILNTLDGFNLQPRITISFDGPINPSSVSSKSVFLVEFGAASAPRILGINQVVWDTATNTLYLTSDEQLPQHAKFILIVTKGILDTAGKPVQTSPDFAQFVTSGSSDYQKRLLAGLDAAAALGIARDSIVTASAFTTLSATAILEKIRDQVHASVPMPSSFMMNGVRTVFARKAISSIVVHRHTRVAPAGFTDATYNLSGLDLIPDSVSNVAFGTFSSPNYETPQMIIPQVGTLTGNPVVQGTNSLVFSLIVPSGPKPAKGWPVAIMGHYNQGSKEDIYLFASILAKRGMATIAINGPGHGFGALGTADIKLTSGEVITIPAGGRGVDMDGNNTITANEGLLAVGPPYSLIANRDGIRQTVADLMQLVRIIQVGMDMDGDGKADLDSARITYLGSSLGGNYGIPLQALEQAIRASAVAFAGGSRSETWRYGAFRGQQSSALSSRIPSLINSPGVERIGGRDMPPPFFNENKPLRNLPPVINNVAGAVEIQRFFDHQSWSSQPSDPVAFAPYIRKKLLTGMTARPILILMAKGDQTVPVPVQTALVRAGELADITTYFRFDLAYAQEPKFPSTNPHIINTGTNPLNIPLVVEIATGMQEQAAAFLESDGTRIMQAQPAHLFEVPIKLPLPENLEYVNSGQAQAPVDSASYSSALSPGSLFTIIGPADPVNGEQIAGSGNLPTTLGGIMVNINGRPAPLSYVGRTQINGQVPYETAASGAVAQVVTNGISGAEVHFAVNRVAPRIFTSQGNMCVAQNHDGTLNSPTNPAKVGRYIGVYLIGIGAVGPNVPTGAPARPDPYSIPPGPVNASIGGRAVIPTFLGLIPGLVGVAEVDLSLPTIMSSGLHSFSMTTGNVTSNSCRIAVGQ